MVYCGDTCLVTPNPATTDHYKPYQLPVIMLIEHH